MIQDSLLKTSPDVWRWLVDEGGLDPEFYDTEIVSDLRSGLGLAGDGAFDQDLRQTDIGVEEFIIAFFRAVQPYARMMSDLLQMFERAGATATDHNLRVEFDFEKDTEGLVFELDHFRQWLESWKQVERRFLERVWNSNLLWQLNGVLRGRAFDEAEMVHDRNAKRWLEMRREGGLWPEFSLLAPRSGDPKLDDSLARVWEVWQTVVEESSRYGRSVEDLIRLGFGREVRDEEEEGNERWPLELLAGLASDFWDWSLVAGAYRHAEEIATGPPSSADRSQTPSELSQKLDRVFEACETREVSKTELLRALEDFLSLPAWKHRHELYSAWISSEILAALDDLTPRIHQMDGRIEFSFSGSHLATVDSVRPALHLWSELRSPLAEPVGKGRSGAIQPDYSLMLEPVSSPAASILEVECKQYRQQSVGNFSDALTDYARGRPNAKVVLVNYGPVTASVLDRVPDELRHRTFTLGRMRPDRPDSLKVFRQLVEETVLEARLERLAGSSDGQPKSGLASIGLTWGSQPADLDLHVFLESERRNTEVYFSARGDLDEFPWARLDRDVQNGSGPERIEIRRLLDGTYTCAVKNYSGSPPLAGCGAEIRLVLDGWEEIITCPDSGSGTWWSVFRLDARPRRLTILNRIEMQPPW